MSIGADRSWKRNPLYTKGIIMTITVFTKPSCVQCTGTFRALDSKEIDYEVVDVLEDERALAFIKNELGYLQAPVVLIADGHWTDFEPSVDNDHWSGFMPDKIDELHARLARVA